MLEPTKKRYPKSRDKEEAATKWKEMHKHDKIKKAQPEGGQHMMWRTIISKKFSHSCEGSEPHIRLPSLGM